MSDTKLNVLVGPYRIARRYAASLNWPEDSYAIVCRAHQLRGLDPARITAIVTVRFHSMGQSVVDEIKQEIDSLTRLWPIPRRVAA